MSCLIFQDLWVGTISELRGRLTIVGVPCQAPNLLAGKSVDNDLLHCAVLLYLYKSATSKTIYRVFAPSARGRPADYARVRPP